MPIRKTPTGSGYEVRLEFRRRAATRDEAERMERLIREEVRRAVDGARWGLSPAVTIMQGLDEFCRARLVRGGVKPETVRAHRAHLERFAKELAPGVGDVAVDRIRAADLDRWVERRLSRKGYRGRRLSRRTVAKELGSLRAFARWASAERRAPRFMDAAVYRLDCEGEKRHQRRVLFLPIDECRRCIQKIGDVAPHVSGVLWGMLLFGVRPKALLELSWRDVALPRKGGVGNVRMPALKHGRPVDVPIPPASPRHELLLDMRRLFGAFHGRFPRRADPVFPTRRGRSTRRRLGWTSSTFSQEVRRIADRLRLPREFVAYTCRHSGITWLKQTGGLSPTDIRHYAKHLREGTQEVYDRTSGEQARPAYEAVEKLLVDGFGKDWRTGA